MSGFSKDYPQWNPENSGQFEWNDQWTSFQSDASNFFPQTSENVQFDIPNVQSSNIDYNQQHRAKMAFFYEKPPEYQDTPPMQWNSPYGTEDYENEPPLLEELGIFPDEIMKKVMVVLDPFRSSVPIGDYDLTGPLIFCLMLAFTMLLSEGKVNFGYVYGIAMIGCGLMYCLLWAMVPPEIHISLVSVASVLGYSLLPVVILSAVGIFVSLKSMFGLVLAIVSVLWASWVASRVFVTMSTDHSQRPLVAYPCALLYAVFTLLVIF